MRLRVVELCRAMPDLGPAHATTLGRVVYLADSLAEAGRVDEAVKELQDSMDIINKAPESYVPSHRKWVADAFEKYRKKQGDKAGEPLPSKN